MDSFPTPVSFYWLILVLLPRLISIQEFVEMIHAGGQIQFGLCLREAHARRHHTTLTAAWPDPMAAGSVGIPQLWLSSHMEWIAAAPIRSHKCLLGWHWNLGQHHSPEGFALMR